MGAEDLTVPVTPGHRWKHHTLAEKQALIAEIERQVKAGRGVRPVARELGIAPGNYYRWLSEGLRPAVPAAEAAETMVEKPATVSVPAGVDARERTRIIAAVRASLAEGTPVKAAAKRHGITEGTFYRWVREAARTPAPSPRVKPGGEESRALVVAPPRPLAPALAFRPVSVVVSAPVAPAALVLVAPSGHRIEGLDVTTAAALLRALS